MKLVLVFLAWGLTAHAEQTAANDFCTNVIVCGTYQVEDNRDPQHPTTREITMSEQKTGLLRVEFATIDNGKRTSYVSNSVLEVDGKFSNRDKSTGETIVTGICRNMACTMVDAPYLDNGHIIETLAVFRFVNNTLEFSKFYVDENGQSHSSLVTFIKK